MPKVLDWWIWDSNIRDDVTDEQIQDYKDK